MCSNIRVCDSSWWLITLFILFYQGLFAQNVDTEIFVEEFDYPKLNFPVNSTDSRNVSITNSIYHFEHIGNDEALMSARELPFELPEEYGLHASLKFIKGEGYGYGIVFGYLNANNFHRFVLSSLGHFNYGYYENGKYHEPIPWSETGRISPPDFNTISVEVNKNTLKFLINGFTVASAENPGFKSHKVGFIIYKKQMMDIDKLWITQKGPIDGPKITQMVTKQLESPEDTYKDYENKYALVIGNGKYKSMPLKNPINDANAMAEQLEELGFTVFKFINATESDFRSGIRQLNEALRNNPGVGLFYYAGHGIQSNGVNYLVPIDADIKEAYEIEDQCVPADLVLRMLSYNENPMNIIILDACRNNPYASSFRSADRGLAQPASAPTGSIVAFATAPGKTASDGDGKNGLYTQELLEAMKVPGLTVEEVFKRVRINVDQKSGGVQVPWENSSLMGDFYFKRDKN